MFSLFGVMIFSRNFYSVEFIPSILGSCLYFIFLLFSPEYILAFPFPESHCLNVFPIFLLSVSCFLSFVGGAMTESLSLLNLASCHIICNIVFVSSLYLYFVWILVGVLVIRGLSFKNVICFQKWIFISLFYLLMLTNLSRNIMWLARRFIGSIYCPLFSLE